MCVKTLFKFPNKTLFDSQCAIAVSYKSKKNFCICHLYGYLHYDITLSVCDFELNFLYRTKIIFPTATGI